MNLNHRFCSEIIGETEVKFYSVVKHPNDLHVTSYLPAAQTTEEYADILDDSEYSIICMN